MRLKVLRRMKKKEGERTKKLGKQLEGEKSTFLHSFSKFAPLTRLVEIPPTEQCEKAQKKAG